MVEAQHCLVKQLFLVEGCHGLLWIKLLVITVFSNDGGAALPGIEGAALSGKEAIPGQRMP